MTTENTNPNVSTQTVVVPTKAPTIDKGLVARSIVYLIAVGNYVAPHLGLNLHLHGTEDQVYNIVSEVLLIGSFVQAYWKNNNISKAARIIDKVASQINVFASADPVPNTSDMGQPEAQPAPVAQPAQPAPVAPVADNTNTTK